MNWPNFTVRKSIVKGMKFKKDLIVWGPSIFWALLIFVGSSLPGAEFSSVGWVDFILHSAAHATEFAVLSLLLYRALQTDTSEKKKSFSEIWDLKFTVLIRKEFWIAFSATVIYAFLDELHQYFVPGRICSFWDFFFDSFGAFLGIYLYPFFVFAIDVLSKNKGQTH